MRAISVFRLVFLILLVILLGSIWVPHGVDEGLKVVAVRLDDVQDYFLDRVQAEVLRVFLNSGVKVSLAVVAGCFGEDDHVVSVVHEGVDEGLFEVAVHGWVHEDFSELPYEDQLALMSGAVERLRATFTSTEIVTFVPPYDLINEDTVKAAETVGFKVVSSVLDNDSYFWGRGVKHFPETVSTAFVEGEKWVRYSIEAIQSQTQQSVSRYEFAVLVIHPQQFANQGEGGPLNEVGEDSLEWLNKLLTWLSTNYEVVHIKDLGVTRRF